MSVGPIETEPLEPSQRDFLNRVQSIVAQRMAGQQAGHGLDHVQRVLANARQIQTREGGDRLTIEAACLLHDVGDAKFCDGAERSAEYASAILKQCDGGDELIRHVVSIVDNISFRKQIAPNTLTLEGKVVQDADRLDALGAIGIVRTIEYGASCGQPFYLPGTAAEIASSRSGVGHFFQKLLRLPDLLNTQTARQMAIEREQFLRDFLAQFLAESGLPGSERDILLSRGNLDQRQ